MTVKVFCLSQKLKRGVCFSKEKIGLLVHLSSLSDHLHSFQFRKGVSKGKRRIRGFPWD